MFRPPFAARVAAGLTATFVEEMQKLPITAVALPMTTVSQVLQTGMRIQQAFTSLAIKGDEALSSWCPSATSEQPEWVTFDEDLDPAPGAGDGQSASAPSPRESANQGRFELYSMAPTSEDCAEQVSNDRPTADVTTAERPEIAEYLDYDNLTLAQLRARLRTLSVADLTSLLDYENTGRGRAPFQTMLGNRITAATK